MRVVLLLDPETHFGRLRKRQGPWNGWYYADLADALDALGHNVTLLHFGPDFERTVRQLLECRPHVVFNTSNHVYGDRGCDSYAPALLEMLGIRYTGTPAHGMSLAGNKAICKLVLRDAGIRTPRHFVYPDRGAAAARDLHWPLLIKPISGGGSQGLSMRSLVSSEDQLESRLSTIHERLQTRLIIEEYVEGRDYTVGMLGNGTPRVLRPWEWDYSQASPAAPKIVTERIKWDSTYQKRIGVRYRRAKLDAQAITKVQRIARSSFAALSLRDYASMDFRIDSRGEVHVLEVNANPGIMSGYGRFSDVDFLQLVKSIIDMALRRPIPLVQYVGEALLKRL